ncbi:MAG: hypothetical protein HRT67_07670 [Flavobacteriaceae bacterium]|nr:hypothetical protein [Flavobacteriaceae bacterium]
MKTFFNILLSLVGLTMLGQTKKMVNESSFVNDKIFSLSKGNTIFSSGTTFYNPVKPAEGSVHLFKSWKNFGVIESIDDRKFSINNINLNLERNRFESKISEDSIFTFNFNNIKMFVINGKKFKNYYHKGESRVFQLLYEEESYEIFKGFNLQLVKGSVNPMLNRSTDKYVQKSAYYIRENDLIRPLLLKKKNILRLVDNDAQKAKELIEFLKKQ